MHKEGPFFCGKEFTYADIVFVPWAYRFTNVLKHYREFDISDISNFQRY